MTKTQKGQRDTLECTGSPRRDSSAAANNRSAEDLAQTAAKNAFAGLTHAQILNKLTDGGKIQGIYVQDSKWYINAQYAKIINLKAESVTAGILSSTDGESYFDLDKGQIVTNNITATGGTIGGCSIVNGKLQVPAANITGTLTAAQINADNLEVKATNIKGTITAGKIVVNNTGGSTLLSAGDGAVTIAGWHADSNSLYSGSSFSTSAVFLCTGSSAAMSIGGSADSITGWVFKAGSNFGVTKTGALYASDGHFKGKITATSGSIGKWSISTDDYGCLVGSGGPDTVRLYPTGRQYGNYTYYFVIFTKGGTPVGGITDSGWKDI
jgi:cytoskeletal protein CcmA (bactofilin family)